MRSSWWHIWGLAIASASLLIVAGCSSVARQDTTTPVKANPPSPLPTIDPDQVARGKEVYLRNCANCHGQNAEGTPNWQQLDARGNLPPPPHDDSGHTWRHSDAQLAEIIRNGQRDRFNKTPELTMPPFKERLSEEEIMAVITYFKSLWSPEHRAFQEEQNQRPPLPTPGKSK